MPLKLLSRGRELEKPRSSTDELARRIARRPRNDPDVFLESIAIAETRVYVQHVLQTYGIYRWLYP